MYFNSAGYLSLREYSDPCDPVENDEDNLWLFSDVSLVEYDLYS